MRRRIAPPERSPDVRLTESDAGLAGHARSAHAVQPRSATRTSTVPESPADGRRHARHAGRHPAAVGMEDEPERLARAAPACCRARPARPAPPPSRGGRARAAAARGRPTGRSSPRAATVRTVPLPTARTVRFSWSALEPGEPGDLGRALGLQSRRPPPAGPPARAWALPRGQRVHRRAAGRARFARGRNPGSRRSGAPAATRVPSRASTLATTPLSGAVSGISRAGAATNGPVTVIGRGTRAPSATMTAAAEQHSLAERPARADAARALPPRRRRPSEPHSRSALRHASQTPMAKSAMPRPPERPVEPPVGDAARPSRKIDPMYDRREQAVDEEDPLLPLVGRTASGRRAGGPCS